MRIDPRPWLAAAAAAALLACSGTLSGVASPNPVPGVRQGEWAELRDKATRRALLYDRFSHRATVTATYMGVAERQAKVNRLADWMSWTEQEKDQRLKAELDEASKYEDFFVAFFTGDRKANDLDAPSSVWRVAIRLDGADIVTHDATTLDVDANIASLYPYVSPFDTVYRVRFNKVAGAPLTGRKFQLELASALGKLDLNFGDGTLGPDRPQGSPLAQ